MRTVLWFSAGAASAVAAKLVLSECPDNVQIVYTDTGSEHPDNERFIDCGLLCSAVADELAVA